MHFSDMLQSRKIDPKQVLVFRHRPWEPQLNKVLPWLAAEKPNLFKAYQQTQGEIVEGAMQRSKYVAAFIAKGRGKALFVGLYSIVRWKKITREQYDSMQAHIELKRLGMEGFTEVSRRKSCLWFYLNRTRFYEEWSGRLIVGWPGPERSWWRWAHRNEFPVQTVLEDSALDAAMPEWDTIDLGWEELKVLPSRWKTKLSEWRGIYYIFDTSTRKGYVGSAYGRENLLGRWLNYAARGHGGNRLLRRRNPENFRFSILQRVSPDMEAREVICLENSWKERLHTRTPYGLNDN